MTRSETIIDSTSNIRQDQTIDVAVPRLSFEIRKTPKPGFVCLSLARIIEVTKVNVPVFNAVSADVKEVSDLAKTGIGTDLTEAYLASMRRNSDLVINEPLWQTIRGASR